MNDKLLTASYTGNTAAANALLDQGADVNAANTGGWTALMLASQNGHTDIAQALIMRGANLNLVNGGGTTALMWASEKGYLDIVVFLIAGNVELDKKDHNLETALMLASKNGHSSIVSALIVGNADTEIKNRHSLTARMIASKKGHTDAVSILENGVKPLRDICQKRENEVASVLSESIYSHSLKNIIYDYDCDPALEYLLPMWSQLKKSIEGSKIPSNMPSTHVAPEVSIPAETTVTYR